MTENKTLQIKVILSKIFENIKNILKMFQGFKQTFAFIKY